MTKETMFKTVRSHYVEHKDKKPEEYTADKRTIAIIDKVFKNYWKEYTQRCRDNWYTIQLYNLNK